MVTTTSRDRKGTAGPTTTTKQPTNLAGGGGVGLPPPPPPEVEHLPCPRCDSTNTKFCYYNNYNFSQPRHFCKNCRRYWTQGGTLRDIPVGGGSRKTAKRSRTITAAPASSAAATSSATATMPTVPASTSTLFTAFPGLMPPSNDRGGSSNYHNQFGSFTSLLGTADATNNGSSLMSNLGFGGLALGLEDVGFLGTRGGGLWNLHDDTWQVESAAGGGAATDHNPVDCGGALGNWPPMDHFGAVSAQGRSSRF